MVLGNDTTHANRGRLMRQLRLQDYIPDNGGIILWTQAGIAMVLQDLDAQPDVPDVPDVRGPLAAFSLNNMV